MPKVVILIKRKDHLTHEQFRTYYENNHVPLVKSQIGDFLSHYTRTYLTNPIPLTGTPGQTDFNFDVLTEIRQPNQASLEAMFAAAKQAEALLDALSTQLDRGTRAHALSDILRAYVTWTPHASASDQTALHEHAATLIGAIRELS